MTQNLYVLIANFFPTPGSWRCTYGYDYAQAIKLTKKYQVVVFRPGYEGDYEYHGIKVYGFRMERVTDSGALYYLKYKQNQKRFLERFQSLGLKAEMVAVCEAYNGDLGYYGWALKKQNPRIVTALHHHSLGSFGIMFGSHRNCWPIKMMNFLWMRYVHEHQDIHVFISRKCEASLRAFPDVSWSIYEPYREIARGLGLFRPARIKRAYVLHNGVDCRVFTQEGRRPSKEFRLGCIANCQKLKGHITLLRALDRIKGQLGVWSLRIVGSGETKPELEEFVRTHGLEKNVFFLPEVEHVQLAELYRDLDLFVLPSYFEGFGCVYTEAWACGTPFIACRGFGMDDLIENPESSPWLIEPNNEIELSEKILSYYSDRPVQRLTGPVDIDTLVLQYLKFLEKEFPQLKGKGHK